MNHLTPSRRLFLRNGSIALAAIGAGARWNPGFLGRAVCAANATRRASASKKALVIVFQRGAADGLSMVVPFGDPFYYKHRQEIAIAAPKRGGGGGGGADGTALDLDGHFALHPALDAFMPLYKKGHLAVVHACGSPNSSRSHFDMQDFMESGSDSDKALQSGWANRMVQLNGGPGKAKGSPFRAVAMTSVVPRTLQGDVESLAIHDLATFGVKGGSGIAGASGGGGASGFEGMYDNAVGDVMRGAGKESFDAIALLKKADPTKYTPAKGTNYPANAFGRSLTQVAQLIKADLGLEVAFVEMEGWDTHANQGNAGGQLAGRLHDFSRAIAAFHDDLGDRMDEVCLLTMTEFGRAARQNGNRGTDHGHGTCFFALGGKVKGGRVLGEWPGLAPEKLFEERDLAVTTDFRDVFAEAAVKHFGVEPAGLEKVFPKFDVKEKNFPGIL